jgi:hypothetical protein
VCAHAGILYRLDNCKQGLTFGTWADILFTNLAFGWVEKPVNYHDPPSFLPSFFLPHDYYELSARLRESRSVCLLSEGESEWCGGSGGDRHKSINDCHFLFVETQVNLEPNSTWLQQSLFLHIQRERRESFSSKVNPTQFYYSHPASASQEWRWEWDKLGANNSKG